MATDAAPKEQPADADLRRLGEALGQHSGDVLERLARGGESAGTALPGQVRSSFERICMLATVTVARWMEGGAPEDGMEAGREAWDVFGQLAAHRAAPLNEVTKRCLAWRDAVDEVLEEAAQSLHTPPAALARARAMTQTTLDVTLVHMCEAFEASAVAPRASSRAVRRSSRSWPPTTSSRGCPTAR